MRGPKPATVELSDPERQALQALVRRRTTTQQLAQRARIVLAAADGYNNSQIARQLGLETDTVRHWRQRWLGLQATSLDDLSVADRLADAPVRGGRPRLAPNRCAKSWPWPAKSPANPTGRSASGPGARLPTRLSSVAFLDQISPRHAARLLKRGPCNRT